MTIQQGFKVDIATRYGLKEAIVFAIIRARYILNGNREVCVPMSFILSNAPYLSHGTLLRVIKNLEKHGLIEKRKGYDDLVGLGNIYEITKLGKKLDPLP